MSDRGAERARWRVPLSVVLAGSIGGLVLFAALGVGYLGLWTARQTTVELLGKQADAILGGMERVFERELDPVVDQSRWIAQRVRLGRLDPADTAQLDTFLQGALAATPAVWAIAFVDPDGKGRLYERSDPEVRKIDLSKDAEVARILERARTDPDPKWGAPIWSDEDGIAFINSYTPLFADDRHVGTIIQAVTIYDLSRSLAKLGSDSRLVPFALYDRDRVLAHPLLSVLKPRGSSANPLPELDTFADGTLATLAGRDVEPLTLFKPPEGVHAGRIDVGDRSFVVLIKSLRRYADEPLTIGVYFPEELMRDSALGRYWRAGGFALAVLAVSVVAALFLARALGRPVLRLTGAMGAIGGGDLARVQSPGRSPIREIDTAFRAFDAMVRGLRERNLIRGILGTYVPEDVATSLIEGGGALEPVSTEATVLFVDLGGFTSTAESMRPPEVVDLLNSWFSAAAEILERRGGVITQFQGDAILAVFNVPAPDPDHARNAVDAALAMRAAAEERTFAGRSLKIRIGITTGDLVAGSVGAAERQSYTVHGDVANLAARLEQMNKETGTVILVDAETARQAAGVRFERVGTVEVRGKSAPVTVFTPSGGPARV